MKNLFKNLMLVAVAAMAFTACQNDNNEVNNVAKETTIQFTAGFDASRSQFGEKDGDAYPSFWNGGEYVHVDLVATNGETSTSAYMEKVDEAGASANFSATFYGDYTDGTITVYSPYHNTSNLSGWSNEYNYDINGYQMMPNIPSTQTPNANSVEAAAHILKAEHSFAGALTSGSVDLTFKHAVAYAKMTLNIDGVVALGDIAKVRVEFADQAYTLLPDNLDEPTFWFACEEAQVESMKITITDYDDVTYIKEFSTSAEKTLAFETGKVSVFSVGGFEETVLDYVTSISANNNFWNGRYEFTIDTIDGARIWLYVYTYAEGGLLPENVDGYEDKNSSHSLGYLYADYANWDGYANITETSIIVEHLEDGYLLDFYFFDDKGGEWEFTYEGVVSGICNPPAPEVAEVVAVAESVNGNGEQYFTLNFTADNYKFSQMWFDTKVAGKIIAEGTHNIDGAVAYLNNEGAETGWEFEVSGTVTVAHDAENKQYNLTFDLVDGNGSTFTVTYAGKVEGVYSPGDATPLPNPSNVNCEVVNYTDAKLTWDVVEGAASYELYYEYWTDIKNVSEPVTTTETTYTFEGLVAGPWYTIYVKALPATAANTESEYASVSNVQVYNNPASMETKYTFTKAVNTGDNKIKFSNEAGQYCVIKFAASLTSIAPGMYTSSTYGDFYIDSYYSGFNGNQMYPFGFVNVEGEAGAEQTVTIVGADVYGGEQVKAVFTGVIDMEVAPIEYTTCKVTPSGTDLSFYFEAATGDWFKLYYYANGAMGIAEGEYTLVKNTHFYGYQTYNNKYQYPETISLKVTGNIGEVQTYEFVITIENGGPTYKANYTGVAEGKILYGMTEPVSLAITGSSNDLFYMFTDAEGNTLCINVYNGAPYRDSTTNYTYYQLADGSRRSISSISAFSYVVNEDGSYLFTEVSATDSEGYIHMFSNVTLSKM